MMSRDYCLVLTLDSSKAVTAGWLKMGTLLSPQEFQFWHGLVYLGRKTRCVTNFDYYAELTARTASLTQRKLDSFHVGFVGAGASINLVKNCARTGVTEFTIWDCDAVELPNVGRTGYAASDVGSTKTKAAHRHLLNVNPNVVVHEHHEDFLAIPEEDLTAQFLPCDAIVMGTDSEDVQLRGNQVGYRLGKSMVFPGFYHRKDSPLSQPPA